MKSIAILVLNWNGLSTRVNGLSLLDFCIPSVIQASRNYSGEAKIFVIDNKSTDGSVSHLREKFSEIEVIESPKNDYLFSYNHFISKMNYDVVMFLNSDVWMDAYCLDPIMQRFNDPDVFGVGPDVFSWKQGIPPYDPDSRCMRLHYYKGRIYPVDIGGMIERGLPSPHYLVGAAACFDRNKLLQLKGLDKIFTPFYWEDSDLGFRAIRRGWKLIVEEGAKVYHVGSATLNTSGSDPRSQKISLKNEFIFLWKNIKDLKLRLKSLWYLPRNAFCFRYGGARNFFAGLILFLRDSFKIPKKRKKLFEKEHDTDFLFFNHDLKPQVKFYLMAKVYLASGEPWKAILIAKKLFDLVKDKSQYYEQQTLNLVSDAFIAAFQRKMYRKTIRCYHKLPKELISTRARYAVASCYRELGRVEEARKLYYEIVEKKDSEEKFKGFSYFQIANSFFAEGKKKKVINYSKKCLDIVPNHEKCKQLLEEAQV